MCPSSKIWIENQTSPVPGWGMGWARVLPLCLIAFGGATALAAPLADRPRNDGSAPDGSRLCVTQGAGRDIDGIREAVRRGLEVDERTQVIGVEVDKNYVSVAGSYLVNTVVERAGRTFSVGVLVKAVPSRGGEVKENYAFTYFD